MATPRGDHRAHIRAHQVTAETAAMRESLDSFQDAQASLVRLDEQMRKGIRKMKVIAENLGNYQKTRQAAWTHLEKASRWRLNAQAIMCGDYLDRDTGNSAPIVELWNYAHEPGADEAIDCEACGVTFKSSGDLVEVDESCALIAAKARGRALDSVPDSRPRVICDPCVEIARGAD